MQVVGGMSKILELEKPIIELQKKVNELKEFSQDNNVDLSHEIYILNRKIEKLKTKVYENPSPWIKVNLARHKDRPTTLEYIENLIEDFIELHGDRYFGDDKSIVGGIGYFKGIPVTVIGHQKGKDTKDNIKRNFGMPNPEGYRKALRLMKQAEKFKRPIINFIDTPGAYCGIGAEERGQGEAIARNLMEMSRINTPIISILIGEGGSGGALALGVSNKVFMLENTIYSVISPEGLASILWKDSKLIKEASDVMKLTAKDLYELKVVDGIIREKNGAHNSLKEVSQEIEKVILENINILKALTEEEVINQRYEKFRKIGNIK